MAQSGFFHREHRHAGENHVGTDENFAETRDSYPGGPAVVGHDENIERHVRPEDIHTEDLRRAALHDLYGGFNWGACFFGWLVAVGVTVLLGAIITAVASALDTDLNWAQADLESMTDSVGIAAAITLAVVTVIGYFAGGYVAARMSRFDAARQGLGVWIVAVVVMIIAAAAGALFGSDYDFMRQVDLPNVELSTDQLAWSAAITSVVLLAVMFVAALLGAATGRRYHTKIDRTADDYGSSER